MRASGHQRRTLGYTWPASSWPMTLLAACSALALSSGGTSSPAMALIVKTYGERTVTHTMGKGPGVRADGLSEP